MKKQTNKMMKMNDIKTPKNKLPRLICNSDCIYLINCLLQRNKMCCAAVYTASSLKTYLKQSAASVEFKHNTTNTPDITRIWPFQFYNSSTIPFNITTDSISMFTDCLILDLLVVTALMLLSIWGTLQSCKLRLCIEVSRQATCTRYTSNQLPMTNSIQTNL